MATNLFDLENIVEKDVFTAKGSYCGKLRDVEIDLPRFRVKSIIVDAARGSYLAQKVGGKKAVIIPYRMVESIDDVVMIKHFSGDVSAEDEPEEEEPDEYSQKERVDETEL